MFCFILYSSVTSILHIKRSKNKKQPSFFCEKQRGLCVHTHTERGGGVLWKTDRNQQTTQIRNHCSFLVCMCLCMNLYVAVTLCG